MEMTTISAIWKRNLLPWSAVKIACVFHLSMPLIIRVQYMKLPDMLQSIPKCLSTPSSPPFLHHSCKQPHAITVITTHNLGPVAILTLLILHHIRRNTKVKQLWSDKQPLMLLVPARHY